MKRWLPVCQPRKAIRSARAEAGELREWLWSQVDLLPERYRAVLVLYYLRELSYDEIAEILDLPLGTVKTHLFRAKAELKKRLEHQWPGRPAVDKPAGPEDDPSRTGASPAGPAGYN